MTLGKQNFIKKIFTTKDYIRDGLVVLYDAIENCGFGKHDGTVCSWTDHISGTIMDLGNNVVISNTYLNNVHGNCYFPKQICEVLNRLVKDKTYTIECGLTMDWNGIGQNPTGVTFRSYNGTILNWHFNAKDSWSRNCRGDMVNLENNESLQLLTCSHVCDNKTSKVVFCGTRSYGCIPTPDHELSDEGDWKLQHEMNGSSYRRHHFFRVYSRKLSDDEISHNYCIDKFRFGKSI